MLNLPIQFDDLLKIIDSLSPEQKHLLLQHIDENWSSRLANALDDLQIQSPIELSNDAIKPDIEAAIEVAPTTLHNLSLQMDAIWTNGNSNEPSSDASWVGEDS